MRLYQASKGLSATASALALSFALGAPAYAQVASEDPPATLQSEQEAESGEDADVGAQGDEAQSDQAITVTGSRIRRPNLESQVPVTSIGGEEFFQQGSNNVGDTLNELPQLRSTFAQSNPGLGIGIAGLNLLDLRGLGTQRTLVLVNGRRHVGADILNNAVSPDVNTIPNDLIERVDVVTGGNSAIYGSDAIAGVVNFILKRNFEGLQVRGNAGISEDGFGGNQYVSAMYGMNFGDDRGNVTVHAEFANQDRVFGSDIPAFRQQSGLFVVDSDPAGLVSNSDGIPDRIFIRDVRSRTINRFGLVPITYPAGNAPCGRGISSTTALGTPFNCTFIFTPTGELVPQTGTVFGSGPLGSAIGGNGQTGREDRLLSVLPDQQRYNANLLGHYTFSDAAEAFIEAKFVRVDSLGSNAGPSFIQGQRTQFDTRERVRLDNPFLRPQDRATISNAILTSGCNTNLAGNCVPLTTAQRAEVAAGTYRFTVARSLADIGIRDEDFQRDTYRIVGGLRGTFNDDWNYEVSANYGKMKERTTTFGYLDRQRFLLSLDAGRNPATGQIQCRAQFDPAARVAFPNTAQEQARLAADIAACVPYNPFGGLDNSAAAAYAQYNATHRASLDQLVLSGFVSGDTSQVFELPGGPVSFALGAEYRREKAYYEQDPFVLSGATNAVVIPTFEPDAFEVKEAFGEIRLPILRETPFFEELTVSAAGRVADYKGGTGTVYAYNAGVEWSPVRDLRFRGNYGRAIRAPNVSETAFPLVPNFAPGFQDPCQPNQIGSGTTFRAANCQADLGNLLGNLTDRNYSLPVVSGSNPDLEAEKSDSYTVGAVFQPRVIPGLSLSVDYYNIKVEGVIASLSALTIARACYDQPTLDNVFCGQFERFRGPGTGPFGEIPGEVLGNALIQAPLNFASRVREGVDVELAYRTSFAEDMRLDTRLIYSHQLTNSNFQDPTNPDFENRILGELGDPVDEARWDVSLKKGPFTIGYQMRYIGSMWVNAFEDFNELQGRPPQDLDYSDIRKYPAVFYHDLRFDWDVAGGNGFGRDLNFFVGVDNVFDRQPPLGATGTGTGSAIYSIRGRNYFAGFRARF